MRRLARRVATRSIATLPRALLPAGVDPTTGLCADGLVRIAQASPLKGLGAFAARDLQPRLAIGNYVGEVLTLGQLVLRYGGGGFDGPDECKCPRRP